MENYTSEAMLDDTGFPGGKKKTRHELSVTIMDNGRTNNQPV